MSTADPPLPVTFEPDKLRLARLAARYTQQDVADRIGRSRQAVAKWEAGDNAPDADDLAKLATVFGRPISAFFTEVCSS